MTTKPIFANLEEKLAARIATEGHLQLDDYMAACLTDPDFGYYLHADPLGRGGDFITAPEVSQIFGELIGLWCVVVWQQMGQPATLHLVELGPGRGTLMADALRAARIAPGFLDAVQISLIEASPVLRGAQAESLEPFALEPHWFDTLGVVKPPQRGEGMIVIANEFLDTLPIRQFERQDGEKFVASRGVGPGTRHTYSRRPARRPHRAGVSGCGADLADRSQPCIARSTGGKS